MAGFECVTTDANANPPASECRRLCDTATNQCASGTCTPLLWGNDPLTVNGHTYGACF
jgi:hypothetical protein